MAVPKGMAVDLQTRQAGTGTLPDGSKGWWRLVWCHELCFKAENEARRKDLWFAAGELGAGLVCLKKAKQFQLWISRAPRPPYVLITDWREAQPCIQFLTDYIGRNRPVFTVVICDSYRQIGRATEWKRELPASAGRVQVWERSSISPDLMTGLAGQVDQATIPLDLVAGIIKKQFGPTTKDEASTSELLDSSTSGSPRFISPPGLALTDENYAGPPDHYTYNLDFLGEVLAARANAPNVTDLPQTVLGGEGHTLSSSASSTSVDGYSPNRLVEAAFTSTSSTASSEDHWRDCGNKLNLEPMFIATDHKIADQDARDQDAHLKNVCESLWRQPLLIPDESCWQL